MLLALLLSLSPALSSPALEDLGPDRAAMLVLSGQVGSMPAIPTFVCAGTEAIVMGTLPALPPKPEGCSWFEYGQLVVDYHDAVDALMTPTCAALATLYTEEVIPCLQAADDEYAYCVTTYGTNCEAIRASDREACWADFDSIFAAASSSFAGQVQGLHSLFSTLVLECNDL